MNRLKRPLTLAALLMLSACATRPAPATPIQTVVTSQAPPVAPAPVNTACTAFGLISFDRLNDTIPTINQVKAYNAAWTALCGAR